MVCEICETSQNIEVDHHKKENGLGLFCEIRDEFIRLNQPIPTQFWWDDKNTSFRINRGGWEQRWYEFHLKHAKYRYLCSNCNKKAYHDGTT